MVKPLISLATISYNQETYLSQAIESVTSQLTEEVEYLVFDGGSTDGSRDTIEANKNHLSYWQSCPDGGPASALQKALEKSQGEYFMYLNSDDFLLPRAISTALRAVKRYRNIDVFYGNGLTLDERNGTISKTFSDRWNLRAYACGGVSIFQQACILRRKLAMDVGGFNSDNTTCWDGELLFDMARAGAVFRKLEHDFAVFRLHEESISGSQSRQSKYYDDRLRMAKKIGIHRYAAPGLATSILKLFRQPDIAIRKLISKFDSPSLPAQLGVAKPSNAIGQSTLWQAGDHCPDQSKP